MRCRLPHLLVTALATSTLGGCGGDSDTPAAATTPAAAAPALGTRPAAKGEIVGRGEASPATHGPYDFDGRYLVRFEQYAPEDAALDFASQTPFAAALLKREGDSAGAIALFETAAPRGRRELTIRGRYLVDVSFGDFPYVLRFTPRGG